MEKFNKIIPIYGSIMMLVGITISDINDLYEIKNSLILEKVH